MHKGIDLNHNDLVSVKHQKVQPGEQEEEENFKNLSRTYWGRRKGHFNHQSTELFQTSLPFLDVHTNERKYRKNTHLSSILCDL